MVTGVPGGIGYAIAHAFATPRVSPFVLSVAMRKSPYMAKSRSSLVAS